VNQWAPAAGTTLIQVKPLPGIGAGALA
jgi:hypothetical protein